MKAVLLLLLSLLAAASAAGQARRPAVVLTPITTASYALAKKAVKNAPKPAATRLTFPVKKSKGQLRIPTRTGVKVYRDRRVGEADDTSNYTYTYLGFAPAFGLHCVQKMLYESSTYYLIKNTGQTIETMEAPHYSPGGDYLLTYSQGLIYAMMPNGIQLFRNVSGAAPRTVWKITPKQWEPTEIFWANDSTVYLKREWFRPGPEPYRPGRFGYAKLTLLNK